MEQSAKNVIVSLKDIFLRFDGEVILNHINLDIHEKEFPWDDAGIAELRDWLQHYYDLYTTTGSLDE